MKKLLIFLMSFFLVISCEKNSEFQASEKKFSAVKKEEQVIQQKSVDTEVKEKEKEVEETVDISNELNKLRKVPDENNNANNAEKCTAYRDADGDKYGDEEDSVDYDCATGPGVGYTKKKGDCNDRNKYVNPGVVETCNGGDDNCDGVVDPEDSDGCNRYYKDLDQDGVGTDEFKCLCVSDTLFSTLETGDCDDHKKFVHQNAKEQCNDLDDNCNGQVDEGENLTGCRPFYFDKDGDGFGYQNKIRCLCKPDGLFRADMLGDCNDNNANVNPDAVEIFDRRDNNCNGAIDENVGRKPIKKHKKHHGKYKVKPQKKSRKIIIHNKKKKKHVKKQQIKTPRKFQKFEKDDEKKKKKKGKK